MNKLVIIFVKNPELGKVKTRLAERIGQEAALAVYLKLLRHTHDVVENLRCDKAVFYSAFIDTEDSWDNKKYKKYLQRGGDLGARMHNAFKIAFDEGYSLVCLIGSDIYDLSPEVIEDAFERLENHNVVIGPAKDGGYYLMGMKVPHEKILMLERWSTPDVFSKTIKKIEAERLSYSLTRLLNDIDEPEDLQGTDLADIVKRE